MYLDNILSSEKGEELYDLIAGRIVDINAARNNQKFLDTLSQEQYDYLTKEQKYLDQAIPYLRYFLEHPIESDVSNIEQDDMTCRVEGNRYSTNPYTRQSFKDEFGVDYPDTYKRYVAYWGRDKANKETPDTKETDKEQSNP